MHAYGVSIGVSKSKRHDVHPSIVCTASRYSALLRHLHKNARLPATCSYMLAGPWPLCSRCSQRAAHGHYKLLLAEVCHLRPSLCTFPMAD